ncbi:glycerophosphodiester phosphodiesterase [Daejeonella oryzae]|uniref:glycerophosphodiester phosphodiesterase n=1 Tax=Daejeonella oryzae TaxID=1122943 RepID=UPI00041D8258|nr:glycerophosphodiester phosphodiesterase family protein [Daejeonella oryzae]
MSTKIISLFIACVFTSSLISCNKNYGPVIQTEIVFLGHKGGGNNRYNDINIENTVPAALEGISLLDGVETDIQMSLDGTIWMFHDSDLTGDICGEGTSDALIFLNDSSISQIELCQGTKSSRLYKLSELIDVWNSNPKFYISLDVKTDWSAANFARIGGKDAYLKKMADQLAILFKNSSSQEKINIEFDNQVLLDQLKTHPFTQKIKTYLVSYGDIDKNIEKAVALNYDGISCDYTQETITPDKIKYAKQKGLSVQLWTPYYESELKSAFNLNPDFIQTDNLKAKRLLGVE